MTTNYYFFLKKIVNIILSVCCMPHSLVSSISQQNKFCFQNLNKLWASSYHLCLLSIIREFYLRYMEFPNCTNNHEQYQTSYFYSSSDLVYE